MQLVGRALDKAKGAQKGRIAKLAKERLEQILADGEANGGSVEKASKKPVFFPETKEELKDLVDRLIKERGLNADLNDIDTSKITDMSMLFWRSDFNGNISKWNVSNVKYMGWMFCGSKFNGDISIWCVSKLAGTEEMFEDSPLEGNEPEWYRR